MDGVHALLFKAERRPATYSHLFVQFLMSVQALRFFTLKALDIQVRKRRPLASENSLNSPLAAYVSWCIQASCSRSKDSNPSRSWY